MPDLANNASPTQDPVVETPTVPTVKEGLPASAVLLIVGLVVIIFALVAYLTIPQYANNFYRMHQSTPRVSPSVGMEKLSPTMFQMHVSPDRATPQK